MITGIARTAGSAVVVAAVLASCNEELHFDVHSDAGDDAARADDAGTVSATCSTDATCAGLFCDAASGACVACLEDNHCSGSLPRCDTSAHVCVACLARSDCKKRQSCDGTTHRCLDGCFDADDVCTTAGFSCNEDLELCVECTSSQNCSGSPNGALCDTAIGRCVQCASNAQCPAEKPVCDRRSGRCEPCVVSATCGPTAVCDPGTLTCRDRT